MLIMSSIRQLLDMAADDQAIDLDEDLDTSIDRWRVPSSRVSVQSSPLVLHTQITARAISVLVWLNFSLAET